MLIALPDRNKSVIRRLSQELWSDGGDAGLARTLLAGDFVDRTCPVPGDAGAEGYVRRALALRSAVTRLTTRSEDLVAEGDLVSERYSRTFWQAGRRTDEIGFAQYRLRCGRVVELWCQQGTATVPTAADELTPREMRV